MRDRRAGEVEPRCLSFLAMFFARTHRMLYRPQCIGGLAEDLGLSSDEVQGFASELQRRGLLRELSALTQGGPLMEITPKGVEFVRSRYPRRLH